MTPAVRLLATAMMALILVGCSSPEERKARHKETGDRHLSEKKYQEAVLEYRNAIKIDARFGPARYGLAQAFEGLGRPQESAREYLRAAELLPDNVEVQQKAAMLYLRGRNFEAASKHADIVLKLDPGNSEAHLIRANALAGLKDLAGAIDEIEEAIQLAPGSSRAYAHLAALRLAEGKRAEAEAAYRKAIEVEPTSVPARVAMAIFYWSTERPAQAESMLKEALALDTRDLLANRALAALYMSSNRPAEAEAALLRLAELDDKAAMAVVADHYKRAGRVDEARAMFEKLLPDSRHRTTALVRLAEMDYAAGKRDAAHARIDEELVKQSSNVELLTLKATLLLEDKKWTEAEETAQKAVTVNADSAPAHYALGLARLAQRKADEAAESFAQALRANPRAAAADVQLSAIMLARGKADDALRHAESARTNDPGSAPARLSVAAALIAKRDWAKAGAEVESLVKDYPQNATVHALHGDYLLGRRDQAAARRAYERALAADPSHLQALNGLSALDVAQKQFDTGRARIRRALEGSPKNAGLLALAGRFERAAGDTAAAERHFRAALDADASTLEVYTMLADLYLRQQKLDQARAEFEELARRAPNPTAPQTMVGIIYELQNRIDDAVKVYEDVVARTKRAPVAANNLAWRYVERGEKLDLALELAQSAKLQLPESAEVDDTLGWIYYKKNMPELAVQSLEKSAAKFPDNGSYQVRLGLAYAKAGRRAEAIRTLEQALRSGSDLPEAEEARRTLATLKG